MIDIEKLDSIKDFQRGFYELAKACEEKFGGKIRSIFILPHDSVNVVEIEFA